MAKVHSSAAPSLPKHPGPPPQALLNLAKAVLLIRLSTDMLDPAVISAMTTCAILLYGLPAWQKAELKAQSQRLDLEESGHEAEMKALDRGGALVSVATRYRSRERKAMREMKRLVRSAVEEITEWDGECGERMSNALKEAPGWPEISTKP